MPRSTARRTLVLAAAAALASLMLPMSGLANAAPGAGNGVTITQDDNTNGCNGVRTTPGSENTTKLLIGGSLVPGGTAIFQVSFPFDPTKLTGQDDFEMTDCVFIGDTAVAKYFLSGVPNGTSPFVFDITLDIPDDADLGGLFCNFIRTEANPTAPQESNRKAGPACFRIGGDIRVVKVAEDTDEILAGASFDVSCDPPGDAPSVPPVVISGLSGATTVDGAAYVASGVSATGEIAIAGPIGTVCTVTETDPPPGYDLPDDPTQTLTIGRTQVTGTFVDPLSQNETSIRTAATSATLGDSISDTATLSGATADAGGTIEFNAYDTPDCSNDPVFTDTVDVSGNGKYTSGSFTPTAVGNIYWIASYSGDARNEPSTGTCGDEGETSVVRPAPTTATPTSSVETSPESSGPAPHDAGHEPLADTGGGMVDNQVLWALALLMLGGALTTAGIRRYQRKH